MKSAPILKNKKEILSKLWIAAPILAGLMLLFCLVLMFSNNSDDTQTYYEPMVEPPSSFYHYTEFCSKEGVSVSWKRETLAIEGETAQIQLGTRMMTGGKLDRQKVYYLSSDESIATVDEYGVITAYKPGVVYITAMRWDNGNADVAELEIFRPITGMMLKKSTVTINVSDSLYHMEVAYSPADAVNTRIIWESKNPDIATVDENGTLHPKSVGMTEVTATTKDGKFSARCFVTVVNKIINVEAVTIQNKGSGVMAVGESMNMIATVSPSNANNRNLTWTTSDEQVAKISKTGKIKAVGEGTAIITARASNGKTDVMELTIEASTAESALNLYGKVTSQHEVSRDILGNTYVNGYTSSVTNGQITYTSYDITLADIVDIQMGLSPPPKIWRDGGSVSATKEETTEYMDPASYYSGAYKYQFLDLSNSNGVSAEELNKFLEGKGILEGQGQAFIDAAAENNISEVYLVAHACLESGNGTSTLANGVEVEGTTVYNMFGIGAYDDSAVSSGSKRAYELGWTSPEAAIKGGAAWISKWYINASDSRQNTLYKMLWNPETPGEHQYATDIGWAIKQAVSIEKIFASFPNAVLTFDIPVYQGQAAITLEQ